MAVQEVSRSDALKQNHNKQDDQKSEGRKLYWIALILGGWALFSVPFVVYQAWDYLENQVYQRGLETGSKAASEIIYKDLIAKASNTQCGTVYITQGNARVDLINVRCLKRASSVPAVQPDVKAIQEQAKNAAPTAKQDKN